MKNLYNYSGIPKESTEIAPYARCSAKVSRDYLAR